MKRSRKLWNTVRASLVGLLISVFLLVFLVRKTGRIDEIHRVNNEISPAAEGDTVRAIQKHPTFETYDMKDGKSCNDSCQEEIQRTRQSHLSKACKSKLSSETSIREVDSSFVKGLDHVYVVDKHKLLFCYVPKVACTNWKRIILMLMGEISPSSNLHHLEIHNIASKTIPTLRKYAVKDVVQRLNDYTKVLFVREPISRLVSAYRDKLETPKNSDSRAFRQIYSARIKGINLKEIGIGHRTEFNTTFYEFISYLASPSNKLDLVGEEHWRTIDELCRPCDLQYDFIGRMETLHRDTDYVIRRILQKSAEHFRIYDPTNFTNSSSAFILQDYIADIPDRKLKALTKRFQIDFEAFNYKQPT